MPLMHVYHRSELPDPLLPEKEIAEGWPTRYGHVADVEAGSPEEAYRLTNTVRRTWWTREKVTPVADTPIRSTSVGDVVVTPEGPKLCVSIGWQEVWRLRRSNHRTREPGATIVLEAEGGRIRNALTGRNVEPTLICVDRDTDGIEMEFLTRVDGADAAVRRVQVNPAEDFHRLFEEALRALGQ